MMLVYAYTRVWVVKEPHISAKELYISAKEPCIFAKEPYLRWVVQKPYASGNAQHTRKRVLHICKRALSFRKRVCGEQMRSGYPRTRPICVALSTKAVDVGTCVHAYMSSKRAMSIRKRALSICEDAQWV